jgi:hypothetical protein
MGCSPSKPDNNQVSPIQATLSPFQASLSPSESLHRLDYPSYVPQSSTRLNTLKPSTRGRRSKTTKSKTRRFSVSPVERDDFWGTMPLQLLIDRLNNFREEVKVSKENFQENIEYVQHILLDLINNFETSTFRVIKKKDVKFKQMVGKYSQGLQFFKALGYRDKEDFLEVAEKLSVASLKHRVKELEFIMKKEELKSVKSLGVLSTGS